MQDLQPLVVLTPVAKEKLSEVMEAQRASGSFLKIDVFQGGGCACSGGYRYSLSLEEKAGSTDLVEEVGGLKVIVDRDNVDIIRGSKIDYHESLQRTGFKIENPNRSRRSVRLRRQTLSTPMPPNVLVEELKRAQLSAPNQ